MAHTGASPTCGSDGLPRLAGTTSARTRRRGSSACPSRGPTSMSRAQEADSRAGAAAGRGTQAAGAALCSLSYCEVLLGPCVCVCTSRSNPLFAQPVCVGAVATLSWWCSQPTQQLSDRPRCAAGLVGLAGAAVADPWRQAPTATAQARNAVAAWAAACSWRPPGTRALASRTLMAVSSVDRVDTGAVTVRTDEHHHRLGDIAGRSP